MDPVLKRGLKSPRGDFLKKFPFASMLKESKTLFKPNIDCEVVNKIFNKYISMKSCSFIHRWINDLSLRRWINDLSLCRWINNLSLRRWINDLSLCRGINDLSLRRWINDLSLRRWINNLSLSRWINNISLRR